jgi:cell division protein FtsQ
MAIEDTDEIPLPGEFDDEEESPFRRRQKVVPVRRGRLGRARRWLRWGLYGVFVLPLFAYGGYRLALFALTSPRFMLTSAEDVVVTGNRFVSREEALNALGFPASGKLANGVSIFRLSLAEKRKQVESVPWVKSATLSRAYPHRLAVSLVERTPVAFVNVEGRVKLVDAEGVLLDKPERASFDFPVLTGLDAAGNGAERAPRVALYEEFWGAVSDEASASGWLVSEVDLAELDDLKAILVQGRDTLQVHFGRENFRERFRNFLTLLPEVQKTNTKIGSIDLRYRNQVVVNPQTPESPGAGVAAPAAAQKE